LVFLDSKEFPSLKQWVSKVRNNWRVNSKKKHLIRKEKKFLPYSNVPIFFYHHHYHKIDELYNLKVLVPLLTEKIGK
jgi:hypothetical protein